MQADTAEIPSERALGGKRLRLLTLESLDGRTRAKRRVCDLRSAIEGDLGGVDRMTAAQRQLAQRAAVLGALLEDIEVQWATGKPIDLSQYLPGVNVQRRVLATLGLERRPKDVTPSLASYLAQAHAAATEPARGDDEAEPA